MTPDEETERAVEVALEQMLEPFDAERRMRICERVKTRLAASDHARPLVARPVSTEAEAFVQQLPPAQKGRA